MDIFVAGEMAERLMIGHGLYAKGWKFEFNKLKTTLGLCSYRRRTIFLSAPYVQLNDEANVRDTILHEIAHALAPMDAGHGRAWKLVALSIGARPERCKDNSVRIPGKWIGICPTCAFQYTRYRRPNFSRIPHCTPCIRKNGTHSAETRITWKENR